MRVFCPRSCMCMSSVCRSLCVLRDSLDSKNICHHICQLGSFVCHLGSLSTLWALNLPSGHFNLPFKSAIES